MCRQRQKSLILVNLSDLAVKAGSLAWQLVVQPGPPAVGSLSTAVHCTDHSVGWRLAELAGVPGHHGDPQHPAQPPALVLYTALHCTANCELLQLLALLR